MGVFKNRTRAILPVLFFVALFLAACTVPQSSEDDSHQGMMTQVPATGMDFDEMFINMMVPHHQGAVEMANIAKQRAEHAEIQQMADAVISSQQEEITQMKDWKKAWFGSSDTPSMSEMPSLHEMPGMGGSGHAMDMQAEVDLLRDAPEPFDLAFIDAMIPHHQSAIDAAQEALTQSTRPEIKELAQAIIEAQQKEIDQMNAWRKAWYPDAPVK